MSEIDNEGDLALNPGVRRRRRSAAALFELAPNAKPTKGMPYYHYPNTQHKPTVSDL
jgi:hypothetical protein